MEDTDKQILLESDVEHVEDTEHVADAHVVADTESKAIISVVPLVWARSYTICLLLITTACLYADQNLLAPNLSAVAKDLSLSENERDWKLGGAIALAFFVLSAPAAMIIGVLADRYNRIYLFGVVVLCGEIPSLCTFFATRYWHVFILRMLTGISIGGSVPLCYSLLGDLCPARKRSIASSLFGAATGLGAGIGQFISGAIGPHYGWRTPFLVVAIPALVSGSIFMLTAVSPIRGGCESVSQGQILEPNPSKISKDLVRKIFSVRSNQLIFIQGLPGCIPWGAYIQFLNDYLAMDKGLGVFPATCILTTFGAGCITGGLIGGAVGQYIYNRRRRNLAIFMGATTAAGTLPLFVIINAPCATSAIPYITVTAFCGGIIAACTGSNVRALLLNCNTPQTRGTVFSIFALADDLGNGLGPFFASALIVTLGRQMALNFATTGWFIAASLLLSLFWTLEDDEDRVQHERAEQIEMTATYDDSVEG